MLSTVRRSRLTLNNSILFVCDIQDRFRPLIFRAETMISKTVFLNNALKTLGVPCFITEHYAKALGKTVPEITQFPETRVFQKKKFSMLTDEVRQSLAQTGKTNVILCGIESHVCVMQSTLDLLDANYNVHIVCDAVSSQREYDRTVALQRLQQSGAVLMTSESVVFELMENADHPKFKEVSTMLKEHNANGVNDFAHDRSL